MAKASIEVRGYDRVLFSGEADFEPCSEEGYDWQIHFVVPNHEVAQFQMRAGEEVNVSVEPDARTKAYIGGFAFQADARFSAAGGHGQIQLLGSGDPPIPLA